MSSLQQQLYRFREEIRRTKALQPKPIVFPGWWKYFLKWKADQDSGQSALKNAQPWMTYPVIDYLKKNIKAGMKIFEYGGGGSTLFFLARIGVKELVTVEHNKEWFDRLSEEIETQHLSGWKGILLEPEKNLEDGSASDPHAYLSADTSSKGLQFRKYASAIDVYEPGYFDLVLVDGRARPSCLLHAIPKLKKGGWLILDNSERSYYLERLKPKIDQNFVTVIEPFGPVPYIQNFSQTTVWKKR